MKAKEMAFRLSAARMWWLVGWNLRVLPHNAWAVLVTAYIMIESRAWKIHDAQLELRRLVLGGAAETESLQDRFATQA